MNGIRMLAFGWLVFVLAFCLGLIVSDAGIWPSSLYQQVKHFLAGHSEEGTSLKEKIENDLNFRPSRHIKTASEKGGKWLTYQGGFESEKHRELLGLGLQARRDNPRVFLSDRAPDGYRLLFGTFDFAKALHGAILLDHEGRAVHVWPVSQEGVDWEHKPDTNIFPHGFEIAPDGSIVVAFDSGSTLTKYDYCGNILWQLEGRFNHSIDFEGEDAIWVWKGFRMVKINYHTGETLKQIPLRTVMNENPEIDIFGILQSDNKDGSRWLDVDGGYWHRNDIDPLPKALEPHYPDFQAGDLLVSLRSPNLVFVMDQHTYAVKWWRQGLTRRQHDPDWNTKGTITIFNNNMHRGYSNIMEIDPATFAHEVVVDGEAYSFYTWYRGKHQRMPDGGFLVTSPEQGRVFETDAATGDITFEFINTYTEGQEYLAVSEARFLPLDFFTELPQCEPE